MSARCTARRASSAFSVECDETLAVIRAPAHDIHVMTHDGQKATLGSFSRVEPFLAWRFSSRQELSLLISWRGSRHRETDVSCPRAGRSVFTTATTTAIELAEPRPQASGDRR